MARKTCSKGHIYDSAIYGDNCPFCPSKDSTNVNNGVYDERTIGNFDESKKTEVNPGDRTHVADGGSQSYNPTIPMGGGMHNGGIAGGTVIRPANTGGVEPIQGRKIVGLLVTYDTMSTGQIFNICEGKNYIGRDASVDISILGDSQISSKHLSILYRPVDGKFKFKDEQSSNGTFVNDILTDEDELKNFDVIRIGSTRLVFIAIPQLA